MYLCIRYVLDSNTRIVLLTCILERKLINY